MFTANVFLNKGQKEFFRVELINKLSGQSIKKLIYFFKICRKILLTGDL